MKQSNQEVELTVWVQTQAKAGNWVDDCGLPFGIGSGRSLSEAIAAGKKHVGWAEDRGEKARLVIKHIEVINW